jgi:ribonuclease P/MRP protein subunit RPP1
VGDSSSRRNIISNATGLVRGTRGRGLLISSEAQRVADLRGPFDVINFATFWGLKQEMGMGDASKVLLHSRARRETYKGTVQILTEDVKEGERIKEERAKRKVVSVDLDDIASEDVMPKKKGRKKRKQR